MRYTNGRGGERDGAALVGRELLSKARRGRGGRAAKDRAHTSPWPAGGGEMAARIRAHDWAATPLGSIASWPQVGGALP